MTASRTPPAAEARAADTALVLPALGPVYRSLAPLGEALPRIAAGLLLVPHGAQKLFGWFGGHGLAGTAQWLDSIGFAPGFAVAVAIGLLEFVGGLLLALGLFTRPIAAAVAVFMAVALVVHWPAGYAWNAGGWEMPLFWGLIALALVIRGGGALSLDRALGREV